MTNPDQNRLVLLLDAELERATSLRVAFANDPCGFSLLLAHDDVTAEATLEQHPVALLVAGWEACGADPLRFLFAVRGRFPLTQLTVYSDGSLAAATLRLLEEAGIPLLSGPLQPALLRRHCEEAVRRDPGFVGTVADFDLIDTLQLLHLGRHSRKLRIVGPQATGELIFVDGQLIHARLGDKTGEGAFLEMIGWPGGVIQSGPAPPDPPHSVSSNWVHLAMEGLRRLDEQRHREKLGLSVGARSTPIPVSLRELSPFPLPEPPEVPQTAPPTPVPSAQAGDPLVDSLLEGRYHLGRLLETTPLLRRYQAQAADEQRQLWLSVLDERLFDPDLEDGSEALARWATGCRTLTAPGLVRLLDHGQLTVGGRTAWYLVTEATTGQPLTQLLDSPWSLDRATEVVRQLAVVLRQAHRQGMIHGHLHPACLRLGGTPLEPRLEVLDLGLVPVLQASQTRRLDQDFSYLGSPLYLAPEQLTADAAPGPRADIHALGVLLHVLLAGNPPYRQATLSSLVAAKLAGRPPAVTLATLPEPQRTTVETLLLRCFAREPQDRPRSIDEVLQVLEAALEGRLIEQRLPREHEPLAFEESGSLPALPATQPATRQARARAAAFVEQRLSTPLAAVGLETSAEPRSRSHGNDLRATSNTAPTAVEPRRGARQSLLFVAVMLLVFACGLAAGLLLLG